MTLAYELRIGVTGHRDLPDPEAVLSAVERLMDTLQQSFSRRSGPPVRWVVISPLAKGADRLVARAVLQRPGAKLEVITPFPLVEYRHDFEQPTDLAEFEQLVRQADSVVELANERETSRSQGYLAAGRAVVESSEIVIAVWDGQPAASSGGTLETIKHALEHKRVVLWVDNREPSSSPRVLTRRSGRAAYGQDNVPLFTTTVVPEDARRLSIGYRQFAEFVYDAAFHPADDERALACISNRLLSQARDAGLDTARFHSIATTVLPNYVRANALAMRYQARHEVASCAIHYLSAAAVSIVVAQVLFFPTQRWLILLEVLAMVVGVLSLVVSRWQAWHEKWLDTRYLAEQFRAMLFSRLLDGPSAAQQAHSPTALPFYAGPKNWLLAMVRQVAREVPVQHTAQAALGPLKQFVVGAWLADQRDWHWHNAQTKERLHGRTQGTVLAAFSLTLVMAVLHAIGIGHAYEGPAVLVPGKWITFFAIVLPAWGAAIHAIGKQFEFDRGAARSAQMARILNQLIEQAESAVTLHQLQSIVQEAVHLMSVEMHEWWVLFSFAAPELTV